MHLTKGVLDTSSQVGNHVEWQESMAYLQYFEGLGFRKIAMQTDEHMHGHTRKHEDCCEDLSTRAWTDK